MARVKIGLSEGLLLIQGVLALNLNFTKSTFVLKGIRYTETWFKTKKEAQRAEAKQREELNNPPPVQETSTDMAFLDLINIRLDYVKAYNSERHYKEYLYMARRWTSRWRKFNCSQVTMAEIHAFVIRRKKVSALTANKEARYLRATFNFGIKKKLININPAKDVDFFPEERRIKYVPSSSDIDKVINLANLDSQDYLWTIRETMARVSEINLLTWDEIDLEKRYVVLYTRKKKGSHLTPRRVPMTDKLHEIMNRRFEARDSSKKWVFWHRYFSRKNGKWQEDPYQDRKGLMRGLCRKADVRYLRYHALRHSGASIMKNNNVSIGTIQKVLVSYQVTNDVRLRRNFDFLQGATEEA